MGEAEVNTLWQAVCEADDQSAFRTLFDGFYLRLVRFAADLAGTREAAEEIVSDVFVQLWKNRRQTAGVIRLKTYLYTAVRHRSYNYIRDHQQHRWLGLDSIEEPAEAVQLPSLEWKELQQQLDKAVDRLSPQCRTVFRMVREEGFKYKEVAAILDISPRTVETQLVRAVARLRETLQAIQHPVR
ncbi:RNA polymerase sigma-70 factor [Chitinophaga oryzae]|uniref:RNA polymerase sigma-70 factor n=1 Tax=Chitinophaga oryzae TaxID=2725414 RepID=A0AAE6ZFH6_9BACT|nr:RNA polymerase sigma-70 factor [Chitinophaga oryzae]QJB32045.1 RNA polymerase sigma-70 factor [Chitinophaga oryzae]QJB38522.1 RNA polymerase sigma-70 factor [Chitinophaga oryzae]